MGKKKIKNVKKVIKEKPKKSKSKKSVSVSQKVSQSVVVKIAHPPKRRYNRKQMNPVNTTQSRMPIMINNARESNNNLSLLRAMNSINQNMLKAMNHNLNAYRQKEQTGVGVLIPKAPVPQPQIDEISDITDLDYSTDFKHSSLEPSLEPYDSDYYHSSYASMPKLGVSSINEPTSIESLKAKENYRSAEELGFKTYPEPTAPPAEEVAEEPVAEEVAEEPVVEEEVAEEPELEFEKEPVKGEPAEEPEGLKAGETKKIKKKFEDKVKDIERDPNTNDYQKVERLTLAIANKRASKKGSRYKGFVDEIIPKLEGALGLSREELENTDSLALIQEYWDVIGSRKNESQYNTIKKIKDMGLITNDKMIKSLTTSDIKDIQKYLKKYKIDKKNIDV